MTMGRGQKLLLLFSLSIALSIMFQMYFVDYSDGEFREGGSQRFVLKVVAFLLFWSSCYKYLSVGACVRNLVIKAPLIFVAATIVVGSPFYDDAAYFQALNLLFFMPLFFIDWRRDSDQNLYRYIWQVIVSLCIIQFFLDLLFKAYTGITYENLAVVGGMGNANVFGYYLLISALACKFLWKQNTLAILLCVGSVFTGSLTVGLLATLILLDTFVRFLLVNPVRVSGLIATLILIMIIGFNNDNYEALTRPIWHAVQKGLGIVSLLVSDGPVSTSSSYSIRANYTAFGLTLLSENPLSLIFGHPNFMPIYTGDGYWIFLLVTVGVPITLLFLVVNGWLVIRGLLMGTSEAKLASCVVAISCFFFIFNRLLDYWPGGFVYCLAFSYLCVTNRHKFIQVIPQDSSLAQK